MKHLKYERKRSLSRAEAADQLSALADALRAGGEAELHMGGGVLNLRIPEELRGEIELSVEDGEVEVEVELKWPIADDRKPRAKGGAAAEKPASRKSPKKPVVEKAPAKKGSEKAPEKKAQAKKTPAKKTPAKKTPEKKASAEKTAAENSTAKKAAVKKPVAKKAVAKKAAGKKASAK
ncbi:amphi-Trp domain-containing protein [Streptomyces sp. NPDC035033]|uniref:amphi-Trp domain-containing protein n=1 Tax=Streptomyces sp. NPDC035033 TaxID=3155368 RepID=UPI0033E6AD49